MNSRFFKGIMTVAILGTSFIFAHAQTGEVLTNSDVVKLTKLGLAPSTIISKIEATNSDFNVSVDSLMALQQHGVNKDVINEMVAVTTQAPPQGNQNQYENRQANDPYQREQGNTPYKSGDTYMSAQSAPPPPAAYSSAGKDINDPATWRSEGIYYYSKSNPGSAFIPINGDVISGMKTGGYGTRVAQYYTWGFARNKQEAVVDGTHSYRQLHDGSPMFYFYFSSDHIMPGQFVLVNMIQKRDSRVVVVGSSNYYERTKGIDERQRVDFTYEKVGEGVYKVHPMQSLEPGEYCFMYTGPGHTPFSDMVYDFGIAP